METRDAIWAAPGIVVFIFFSSLLGLTGRFVWLAPGDAFAFMAGIWGQSAAANTVFVLGSALAAIPAYGLAQRGLFPAMLAGALANWLVYFASFLLLPDGVESFAPGEFWRAFPFVGGWGVFGLLWGALAPPLVARWRARRAAEIREGAAA